MADDIDAWLTRVSEVVSTDERIGPWSGFVWRTHSRRYRADSFEGSKRYSGRFNRGLDDHSSTIRWPALYTACSELVALSETVRNIGNDHANRLSNLHLSSLEVHLERVLFAHSLTDEKPQKLFGIDFDHQCERSDYHATHEFARLVRDRAEAMLVPSCTGLRQGNLIVFPDRMAANSVITVVESINLSLVKWEP